uniref:Uncharacterized protein n=1 Tax=Eutreptiella gymnastica TaxID=73025 RepID=A0A7S4D2P1_9EUGL
MCLCMPHFLLRNALQVLDMFLPGGNPSDRWLPGRGGFEATLSGPCGALKNSPELWNPKQNSHPATRRATAFAPLVRAIVPRNVTTSYRPRGSVSLLPCD